MGFVGLNFRSACSGPSLSIHLQVMRPDLPYALGSGPGFVVIMGLVHQVYFGVSLGYIQIT